MSLFLKHFCRYVMNISKLVRGDIAIFKNRQATLGFFKSVTLGLKRHALNMICTDNMRSCDMREYSDWLIVILEYKSVHDNFD